MFFKIGVLKNLTSLTGNYLGWSLFLVKFLYRTPPVATSIYVNFHECFFFYFSLAAIRLLPYRTVTFFVWRNTFVFMPLLLYMINIITAEWFIRIWRIIGPTVLSFPRQLNVLVLWCSSCWNKLKKKPIKKVQLENILSFRSAIWLICQECLISLNSVWSLAKQTQTY